MAQMRVEFPQPDDETSTIHSLSSLTLESPPSCLEFVPKSLTYPSHFVVGTYSLDNSENSRNVTHASVQARSGSLLLFGLSGQDLQLLKISSTPYAVLDLRFSPEDSKLFAVATSIGAVELYGLTDAVGINKVRSFQISDSSILVLSLAWSPKLSNRDPAIGVSLSDGQVGYVSYTAAEKEVKLVQSHSMEAWTVAWSIAPWANIDVKGPSLCLYSGGDDSLLCKNGDAQGCSDWNDQGMLLRLPIEPLGHDMKTHEAGVTAILPLPVRDENGEQVILTGSYDEHVRALTLADGGRRSRILIEKRIHGGGIWRLKNLGPLIQDPEDKRVKFKVLASCMHAGTRVLDVERSQDNAWSIRVVAKFVEHESMNYASDFRRNPLNEEPAGTIVVSASFYDRKLCVWNPEREKTVR